MKIEVFVSRVRKMNCKSKGIMKAIGADFSHVGLLIDDQTIWHHIGKGFCTENLSDFLKTHSLVKIDITKIVKRSPDWVDGYFSGRLGIEYSQSQYLGFLFPKFKPCFRNGAGKGVCSESVVLFLNEATTLAMIDPDFVNPKQVWQSVVVYMKNFSVKPEVLS